MHVTHALLRSALLGSTLVVAALAPAAGATLSRADMERLAATGNHASAMQAGNARGFTAESRPGKYKYAVLHDFAGTDGQSPTATVTLDSAGNVYATADYGGANSGGTLVKIAPDGTETVLHAFGSTGDGSTPDGAVTIDSSGNIIGTTNSGGSGGNGTIWELAADGTYSILHSFATNEGSFVRGRLVEDSKGNFYGTALFGGSTGDGTIFEYSPNGTLTVLHTFGGTDGQFPEHGLARDAAGNLFGATAFGGTSNNGSVYEVAANGTFSSLYSFTGGTDGGFLYGTVAVDKNDNLYGNAANDGANGAGTVFKLASNGTLTVLYNFTNGTDGGDPEGDMLLVGKDLYSTAGSGGGSCACGVVYKVTATGTESVLHAFAGGTTDGGGYSDGVIMDKNALYGTTESDGTSGDGVVFRLKKKK
jgi:uncharacterized repeat protein (TIGR03803 family)